MSLRLPPLSSDRLLVRDFAPEDFAEVHRILDREGSFGEGLSEEGRRAWFDWTCMSYSALAALDQPPWGERAVTLSETGEVIGVIGYASMFHPLSDILEGKRAASSKWHPEIGLFWAITPAHRGKGYAVEAARLLTDYAFEHFNLKRIVANTDFDNKASQSVMRKLGMRILENHEGEPPWFEVLGILDNT